ncbi:MAG TPA: MMPL family transporter, partial [Kribbella sp.]|nr:MMPL family transporter [Kribbella sp.]
MFHRIGRVAVRHPIWTIVAWLVIAVAVVATAPSLPSSSDQSSFLPKSYESIQAAELQQSAFPSAFTPSAIVLYQRSDGGRLTPADLKDAAKITTELGAKKIDQVEQVVPGPPSKDGRYVLGLVSMNTANAGQQSQLDAAKTLRDDAKALTKGTHLDAKLGGSAAQGLDQQESSTRANMLTFVGTFAIILITLLIIFRSPILALLPLLVLLALVSSTANGLIADATKLFGLEASSSISALLIVVLLGVGTDYYLFLMFRYRERLRAGDQPKEAMINAVARVGEAIASAAGAVMIAFLALLLSTLGFLKQMGPALAITVAVTLVAALTLFPAICSLIPPRVLFWPSKAWRKEPSNARFAALGRAVQRRPALFAAVSGIVMVALALGTLGFKATFDLAAGSMPETKESMVVQTEMQSGYSAGAAEPTSVLVTATGGGQLDPAALPAYEQKLRAV